MEIRPQPGPQEEFLATSADVAVYGGAAGGGKSWALLAEPLRHIAVPSFGAVIFRRTFPQITNPGGLWDEAGQIYPLLGGLSTESKLEWTFPSGARIEFHHLQYEQTKFDWQGSQVPLIEFDELTHFTEGQFFYLFSRSRSLCGVKPYIRASCNPDASSWVKQFLAPWVDKTYPQPAQSGEIRWFTREAGTLKWVDANTPEAKSVTFIRASIYDNKILLTKDPGYLANLMALPLVDRRRLLDGDWDIMPAGGKVFNRSWFEVLPAVPEHGEECRFWDFAATEKEMAGDDPDYTVGVKLRKAGGIYYVVDCLAAQSGPAQVEKLFMETVRADALAAQAAGRRYCTRWEIEPGSASIRENRRMVSTLDGIDAKGARPSGDKITRAKPLATQAEVGNVKLLQGQWNEAWLTQMHHQPDWPHDDIMDATAGAYTELSGVKRVARSYQG